MVIEGLLDIIFYIVYGICNVIPNSFYELPSWAVSAISLLKKGLGIFPVDVWVVVLANGMFWLVIQFTWAIIEWIYKKIPGVD